MREAGRKARLMSVWRQMKQLELNLGPVTDVVPNRSFETRIGVKSAFGPLKNHT